MSPNPTDILAAASAEAPIALNQQDAARAIGVTDRTLRNWEARGLIAGRRVAGGVRLYAVEDLRRLAGGGGGGDVRQGRVA
jgi:hypothetical protein